MNGKAHRRFALGVVASLESALAVIRRLMETDLEPQLVSVIGLESSFAGELQNAVDLARIVSRSEARPSLAAGSDRIVALARDADASPKAIAANAQSFGDTLRRWLPFEHAERLLGVITRGEFLLLVELRNLVEERVATRILLRNCRGSVEVHDIDGHAQELRL